MNYTLDPSSKKYVCPSCGRRTFVVIIDLDKNIVDPNKYGRCDREDKCGYLLRPDGNGYASTAEYLEAISKPIIHNYRFDVQEVNSFIGNYEYNNLFNYISTKIDPEKVRYAFEVYRVGVYTGLSNFDWTIFWQIDSDAWVRTAKIIKYNKDGRRDKSYPPTWYHSLDAIKKDDYEPKQCLFGQHLKGLGNPIAVVESEKTAIISSLFIPKFTWMATGGKSNFRLLNRLKGQDVTLFPDLGAFELWKEKADKYDLKISDYIENIASDDDRDNGLDLADFLMK